MEEVFRAGGVKQTVDFSRLNSITFDYAPSFVDGTEVEFTDLSGQFGAFRVPLSRAIKTVQITYRPGEHLILNGGTHSFTVASPSLRLENRVEKWDGVWSVR